MQFGIAVIPQSVKPFEGMWVAVEIQTAPKDCRRFLPAYLIQIFHNHPLGTKLFKHTRETNLMDVEKIMKVAIPLGISAVFLGFLFKGYKPPSPPTPP
ncbi:MAG: hypothetical protein DRJ45_09045, partial [Thermoprotei archaeon]